MDANVVFKRDNKWYLGKITNDKLRKNKQIQKLSDVTDTQEYITLKKWLKDTKSTDIFDDLISKYKVTSLYIKIEKKKINVEENKTKITEKDWWKHLNETCLKCIKKCKQSVYAEIYSCPSMKLKEK